MPLPAELLAAIASPGGGRVALILGAGCSIDAPTAIPPSSVCSSEVHRQLLADGVLAAGDCPDPNDLSAVADVVHAKTGHQRDVVERLRNLYNFKLAKANDGYLIAAALLIE